MSERLAVYTVVVGEAVKRLAEITVPRLARYARRCGAEFCVYEQNTVDGPYFSKFDALIDACDRGYDRMLYVDVDILVACFEDDLFESYGCALHNEVETPVGEPSPILEFAFAEIRRNFDPHFSAPYYNSGVVLLDRETLEPLAKRMREVERLRLVLWEQCQLNWLLREIGAQVENLAPKWNYQYSWTQFDGDTVVPDDLHFLHFCGTKYGDKTEVVKHAGRELGIL